MELRGDTAGKITSAQDFKQKIASFALDTQLMAISNFNGQKTLFKEPFHLLRVLKNKLNENAVDVSESKKNILSIPKLAALDQNVNFLKNKFMAQAQRRDEKIIEIKHHSLCDFVKLYNEDNRNDARARDLLDMFMQKKDEMMFVTSIQNTLVKQTTVLSNMIEKKITLWDERKRNIMVQTENMSYGNVRNSENPLMSNPIITRGIESNREKRTHLVKAFSEYIKKKKRYERLNGKGVNDESRISSLHESFSMTATRVEEPSRRTSLSKQQQGLLEFARELASHADSEDFRDILRIISKQIEGIDLNDIRGEKSAAGRRQLEFGIVKNTLDLLNRTELEQIRDFYSGTHNQTDHLQILPASNEAEKSNWAYIYITHYIIPRLNNNKQEVYIEYDDDGIPIWAVLFYLLRSGEKEVMKKVADSYRGNLQHEVQEFEDLYQNAEAQKEESAKTKARVYASKIGNKDLNDYYKVLLFSLVCKDFKDVESFGGSAFMGDIDNFIWFHLTAFILNDFKVDTDMVNPPLNCYEILQSKFRSQNRMGRIVSIRYG